MKGPFLKALTHQQSVLEKKTTVPVLSQVMLTAQGKKDSQMGTLTLTGTDLELTLEETFPARVTTPGSTTLPVHMLYDIVRKLRDGAPIELCLHPDGNLTLLCSLSQFTLPTVSAEGFPVIAPQELSCRFHFAGCDLRRLIDQTRFAMSMGEARNNLNGIYLHKYGADLRAVATDAHRLAVSWLPISAQTRNMPGVILSRKTASEVRKLIDGFEDSVEVALSETQISFSVGDILA